MRPLSMAAVAEIAEAVPLLARDELEDAMDVDAAALDEVGRGGALSVCVAVAGPLEAAVALVGPPSAMLRPLSARSNKAYAACG